MSRQVFYESRRPAGVGPVRETSARPRVPERVAARAARAERLGGGGAEVVEACVVLASRAASRRVNNRVSDSGRAIDRLFFSIAAELSRVVEGVATFRKVSSELARRFFRAGGATARRRRDVLRPVLYAGSKIEAVFIIVWIRQVRRNVYDGALDLQGGSRGESNAAALQGRDAKRRAPRNHR